MSVGGKKGGRRPPTQYYSELTEQSRAPSEASSVNLRVFCQTCQPSTTTESQLRPLRAWNPSAPRAGEWAKPGQQREAVFLPRRRTMLDGWRLCTPGQESPLRRPNEAFRWRRGEGPARALLGLRFARPTIALSFRAGHYSRNEGSISPPAHPRILTLRDPLVVVSFARRGFA